MASLGVGSYRCQELKVLSKDRKDEAMCLLQRVHDQVIPAMEKRKWKVGLVSEFYPSNAGLLGLNINHGQEIRIRLRPHYDDKVFLQYEELVGTMLHELTHIVHGPHDKSFYALLKEITEETEDLMNKGVTGPQEGPGAFPGTARSIGGFVARNGRPGDAAREAANKRRRVNLGPGGGRLVGFKIPLPGPGACGGGGDGCVVEPPPSIPANPRAAAAAAAAERLAAAARESSSSPSSPSARSPAAPTSGSSNPSALSPPAGAPSCAGGAAAALAATPALPAAADPPSRSGAATQHVNSAPARGECEAAKWWSCPRCTLMNSPGDQRCDACQHVKPSPVLLPFSAAPARPLSSPIIVDD